MQIVGKSKQNARELASIMEYDPHLDGFFGELKLICIAPGRYGELSTVIKYKSAYCLLWREGNGYYAFGREISVFDAMVAKLQCLIDDFYYLLLRD